MGSEFTDEDRENIAASLTDEDLQQRSQALDEAQEVWEEVHYLSVAKMPCKDCSGAGSISGGSLGDICPTCLGRRVIEQPGAQRVDMPPFRELRAAITAYGDARADRALPPGRDGKPHRGKRNLALPPAATVPTLEQLQALGVQGLAKARQLQGAGPGLVPQHLLATPTRAKGMAGEGDLGEYVDAELADMEDAAKEER